MFDLRFHIGVKNWPARPETGPIVAGLDGPIIKLARLGLVVLGSIDQSASIIHIFVSIFPIIF